MFIKDRQRVTDTENKQMGTNGEREGGSSRIRTSDSGIQTTINKIDKQLYTV